MILVNAVKKSVAYYGDISAHIGGDFKQLLTEYPLRAGSQATKN